MTYLINKNLTGYLPSEESFATEDAETAAAVILQDITDAEESTGVTMSEIISELEKFGEFHYWQYDDDRIYEHHYWIVTADKGGKVMGIFRS